MDIQGGGGGELCICKAYIWPRYVIVTLSLCCCTNPAVKNVLSFYEFIPQICCALHFDTLTNLESISKNCQLLTLYVVTLRLDVVCHQNTHQCKLK